MSDRTYSDTYRVALTKAVDAWPLMQACESVLLQRFGDQADHSGVEVKDTAGSFERPTVGEAWGAATEHAVQHVFGSIYRRQDGPDGRWDVHKADMGQFSARYLDGRSGSLLGPELSVTVRSTDQVETTGLIETLRRAIIRESDLIAESRLPVTAASAATPSIVASVFNNLWVVTVVGGIVASVVAALVVAFLR